MPAFRLIPKTDDADFPRLEARALIESLPSVELSRPDFEGMIAAGRRMGWSERMIKANEELAARGNCVDFSWNGPPVIHGTLYEDNVFFGCRDDEQATLAFIQSWADKLDVRVYKH